MTIKLKETIGVDILEDKLVLYDLEKNNFIEMNDIGRAIIEDIKENSCFNVERIIEKIETNYEYECDKNEIYEDINKFVKDLVEVGVLVVN